MIKKARKGLHLEIVACNYWHLRAGDSLLSNIMPYVLVLALDAKVATHKNYHPVTLHVENMARLDEYQ